MNSIDLASVTIRIRSVIGIACVLALLLSAGTAEAQIPAGGKLGNTLLTPSVPLTQKFSWTLKGDYKSAGVGMRNRGYGDITLSLPANSTIVKAILYWAIIRPNSSGPAPNTGKLNGTAILGSLIGTSGTPCWPTPQPIDLLNNKIDAYRADVTGIAVDGINSLTEFPSGLQTGLPQDHPEAYPLLEGASLILVFSNPAYDFNKIVIFDGATSFANHNVPLALGSYYPAPSSSLDACAMTTYILADGQTYFPNDQLGVNSIIIRGPGSGIDPADGANGVDGMSLDPANGLWETFTKDMSALLTPGITVPIVPYVVLAADDPNTRLFEGGDCVTWLAQALSVKYDIDAEIIGPDLLCLPLMPAVYTLNDDWLGATYTWSFVGPPNGATFLGIPPFGNSVTVQPGTGDFTLQVVISVGAYTKTVTKSVIVKPTPPPPPPTFTGPAYPIYMTTTGHVFTATPPAPGVTYLWSLSGNTSGAVIVGSNTGSTVIVDAGPNPGQFTLTLTATTGIDGCYASTSQTFPVLETGCGECSRHLLLAEDLVMFNGQQLSHGAIHSNKDVLIHFGNPSTHTGNITAVEDISIQKYNVIDGDVTAGDKLTLHQPVTITGSAQGYQPVAPVALPPLLYGSFTGVNLTIPQYHPGYSLAPGTYGWVKAQKYSKVKLRTGVYNFNKFELDKGVTIEVDVQQGPVRINTSTKLDFDKEDIDVTTNGGGSILLTVTTKQTTPLEFDMSSRFFGTYIAPFATVRMKWDHITFKGAICAERIDIHKDCIFVDHSYAGPIPKRQAARPEQESVPSSVALGQNYPNPFGGTALTGIPSTTIPFTLDEAAHVNLTVYDMFGRRVAVLADGFQVAGIHAITWDGYDNSGASLPSGTYVYRLSIGDHSESKQMTLTK